VEGDDSMFIYIVKLFVYVDSLVVLSGPKAPGTGDCEAMSREYPDWVSPKRAAEGKRVFSGTVPLSRMRRLEPLLAAAGGEASFVARFSRDSDQRVIIDLEVEASLPLVCQASLDVYEQPVKRHSLLAVIAQDDEQHALPGNYEAVRTEHGRLAIAAMVEDELLLGLPSFPRKPGLRQIVYTSDGGAPAADELPAEPGNNPFSALQDLLKRD